MATLNKTSYTQINTDTAEFLIQNTSSDKIRFIAADVQPADEDIHTGVLLPLCGISDNDVSSLIWGKSTDIDTIDIIPIKG